MSERDYFVHGLAVVEDGSLIGEGAAIWHHAHIRTGASIGAGSVIGKNVFVDAGVSVGERCKIQNNVSVYAGVTIEADVFVGPSAVFTNDLVPRAFNAEWQRTDTHVGQGASIGANATIVCGNVLGQFSMVAAGAVVTKDVPAHALVVGHPARQRGWVCRCGTVISRDEDKPQDLVCGRCNAKGAM